MKSLFALGMLLQFTAQLLFSVHSPEFDLMEPVDIIHWLLLIGLVFIIPFSLSFAKGISNGIGAPITLIGVVCTIGMCAIDFTLWVLRGDPEQRNALLQQLMNEPMIWSTFFTLGPALKFIGLSIQSLHYLQYQKIAVLSAILGAMGVGLSAFMFPDYRSIYLLSYAVFVIALLKIVFSKNQHRMFNNIT